MKANLKYLWYVIRHKWFVLVAGLRLGVPVWQLIVHDLSKLSKEEWSPYVSHFYREGDYLEEFLVAFRLHSRRNPHHWQYWSERRSSPEAMPEEYYLEMVADWMGAGRAITGEWEVAKWYEKNQSKIQLHPATRGQVEYVINQITRKNS